MALYEPYDAPHPPPPPPPDDGWGYPATGGYPGQAPSWPYYWEPTPPSRTRRRSLAAIGLVLL
ncbi:MAG TPA: hypothetical protein VJU79_05525, partial [Candidatus Dormibacteraeota bacterium]|nr:hypothetical protein [Candidatus Dormibacteraeota bacterium]